MMRRTIGVGEVVEQLLAMGVEREGVLVVHTAFSMVAPMERGPKGLIEALQTAVGPDGTVVMPSMTDEDNHPFDAGKTSCLGMGVVADRFWRLPGVWRSESPHAFAAIGRMAAEITRAHPVDVPHGMNSPIGRVYELNGQVLLLGVGHDANTTIHLAENMAGVRYRRPKYATIMSAGQPTRCNYTEIDHCCQKFHVMDRWLEVEGRQRRGFVGYAEEKWTPILGQRP